MDTDELNELQSPDTWQGDGEVRSPVKSPRVIVSVGFSRDDFQRVAEYAHRAGMKTSEFIRTAAIERANGRARVISVSGNVFTGQPPSYSSKPPVKTNTLNPANPSYTST